MSEVVIKINRAININDELWVETHRMIREVMLVSEDLDDEELSTINNSITNLRGSAMKMLDTDNYVAIADIDGDDESVALVELDYRYTGEDVQIKKFFEQDDDFFVLAEVTDI